MEKVSNEILDVIKEIRETVELIQEQVTDETKKLDYKHEEVIEKLSSLENKLDKAIKNNEV